MMRFEKDMSKVKFFVVVGIALAVMMASMWMGTAFAHQQGKKLHLGDAPPDQQIKAITYCDGTYRVTTKKGTPIEYLEFKLRFKTDGSPNGPPPGTPVVIKAGMRGDRGFIIFANPSEISAFIKQQC
jgi:cytochrome c